MFTRLDRLLAEKPYLLADGATGTNLIDMGLQSGDAPEPWNIEHADRIERLHREFISAGSEIVLTNSFGGNFHRLKLHGNEKHVAEINEAAAHIARRVADSSDREVLVAGSMGPTGELFAPHGPLDIESGTAVFAEQAQALAGGGVDVLWVETLSSREEVEAALAGADTTGLPVVCTLSFDTNGSTMMGLSPADFAELCRDMTPRPHAFGANCGLGPAETVVGILNLVNASKANDVLVAKGNCGIPEYVDGVIAYAGSPQLMASYACFALDAGARIIGGCCGTTPEHVRAMRAALDRHEHGPKPDVNTVCSRLGEISAGARAQLEGKLNASTIAVGRRRESRRRRRQR
ncbi:MAG: betaine--homocysteine S-methyltransferase [Acidiferrobacterales bacterium]